MSHQLALKTSTVINAAVSKVWDALTNPEVVKEYFFGTNLITDWKEGGPIRFTGVWDGVAYEDKGTVLKYEPGKMLQYDYWSSWSGNADEPENYQIVTYRVKPKGDSTTVTITQSNIKTLESKVHSAQNWGMLMKNLKGLLEK